MKFSIILFACLLIATVVVQPGVCQDPNQDSKLPELLDTIAKLAKEIAHPYHVIDGPEKGCAPGQRKDSKGVCRGVIE